MKAWGLYGDRLEFHESSMEALWRSCRNCMDAKLYGNSMGVLWKFCAGPVAALWELHGRSMRDPMGAQWGMHGSSMEALWEPHGNIEFS